MPVAVPVEVDFVRIAIGAVIAGSQAKGELHLIALSHRRAAEVVIPGQVSIGGHHAEGVNELPHGVGCQLGSGAQLALQPGIRGHLAVGVARRLWIRGGAAKPATGSLPGQCHSPGMRLVIRIAVCG